VAVTNLLLPDDYQLLKNHSSLWSKLIVIGVSIIVVVVVVVVCLMVQK